MSMFPHTVTLYTTEVTTDMTTFEETETNYITILEGVLLDAVKSENVTTSGLEGADAVTLYIPASATAIDGETGAAKEYIGAINFWKAEDKTGLWTLSTGGNCFFIKGTAVNTDWTAQTIKAYYDDVYDVTKVDFKDFGNDMSHWEVGGT